jgi:Fe-S-cluster containining protein
MYVQPEGRFTCHQCAACCRRSLGVPLEAGEAEQLGAYEWASAGPRFRRGFLAVEAGDEGALAVRPAQRLRTVDGGCVFLDKDNLCMVEKRLGRERKPLYCRAFPLRFARGPDGVRVAVSPECQSLHRSFEEGEPVAAIADLDELVERSPGIVLVGQRFSLSFGQKANLSWDQVSSVFDDIMGLALGDNPPQELPMAIARPVRRQIEGPLPPVPWDWEGPPDMPFYQAHDYLGELFGPLAHRYGLGLMSSAFAELRQYRAYFKACAQLEEGAARFAWAPLRAWLTALRPMQLGELSGGLGVAMYLSCAVVVAGVRIATVRDRVKYASGRHLNEAAAEASIFFRLPEALAAMEEQLLVFDRLVFDAPPSP